MTFIIPQISDQNISLLLSKAHAQFPTTNTLKVITESGVVNLVVITVVLLVATVTIYRLYFHPLSKFPGPRVWAVSRFPYAYNLATGALPHRILELHEQYGPIVRLAPSELSFTMEEAWLDIYGKQQGKPQLQKDQCQMYLAPNMAKSILTEPNDASHGRMRRVFDIAFKNLDVDPYRRNFSHAFSEKTLRESEPILQKYFDKLIFKLRENVGKPIDMVAWIEFTLFDTIGDLLFGRPFDCLEKSSSHFWVALFSPWLKAATFLGTVERFYPPLVNVVLMFLPKRLAEAEITHRKATVDMLNERMKSTDPRPDFLSRVIEYSPTPNGMDYSEIIESTKVLMAGGSETSSSALSAIMYYLLMKPSTMTKIKSEIRSTFNDESEINMASVQSLKYTLAVIYEGLRLFPPLPGSMRRIVGPGGRHIAGHFVPAGTLVAVDEFSAGRYSKNFVRSLDFCPERYFDNIDSEFANDKRKAFRPFSVGPRDCIGKSLALAEMRIILARILFNFDLELVGSDMKDWIERMPAFTFWEKTPLMVKLTPAVF